MGVDQPQQRQAVSLRKGGSGAPPARAPAPEAEGALVVALRRPVRVVVLVIVVPVRLLWDALVVCGRALRRTVWDPLARATAWLGLRVVAPVVHVVGVASLWLAKALFVWPFVALWRYAIAPAGRGIGAVGGWLYRYVLIPAGRGLAAVVAALGVGLAWLGRTFVVLPARWVRRWLLAPLGYGVATAAVWLYRWVLAPLGHGLTAVARGLGVASAWLAKALFLWPWVALWRYVLVPVGRGLGAALVWLGRVLIVLPAAAVYRYVLTPVGRVLAVLAREVADAVVVCWRLAGRVSRAVFGFLARVLRLLLVDPVLWLWRHVVEPVARGAREHVWRPVAVVGRSVGRTVRATATSARASVRQARADVRRALFGAPRAPVRNGAADSAARPATAPGDCPAE